MQVLLGRLTELRSQPLYLTGTKGHSLKYFELGKTSIPPLLAMHLAEVYHGRIIDFLAQALLS